MKVLVTGGCGFIGSHTVDLLVDCGHDILVLDDFSSGRLENLSHVLDRIKIVECDISKKEDWQGHFSGIDWVIHFAGLGDIVPSIKRPEPYFRANVDGTFNVLEAARLGAVKRFVYAASSSCYGIPIEYPTPETAAIDPLYPYALSKHLGEQLVCHWSNVYDFPAVSLRIFNAYGPRSRTRGAYGAVFGVFLAQKLAGKPFTVVGDGTQTRDFVYVSDVARAFVMAAESDCVGEVWNVGTGNPVSVNRLIEILEGPVVGIPRRPGEPDCTHADISKITTKLGWVPSVNFEQGVAEVVRDIEQWKEAPVWTPDSIRRATRDWFKFLG